MSSRKAVEEAADWLAGLGRSTLTTVPRRRSVTGRVSVSRLPSRRARSITIARRPGGNSAMKTSMRGEVPATDHRQTLPGRHHSAWSQRPQPPHPARRAGEQGCVRSSRCRRHTCAVRHAGLRCVATVSTAEGRHPARSRSPGECRRPCDPKLIARSRGSRQEMPRMLVATLDRICFTPRLHRLHRSIVSLSRGPGLGRWG